MATTEPLPSYKKLAKKPKTPEPVCSLINTARGFHLEPANLNHVDIDNKDIFFPPFRHNSINHRRIRRKFLFRAWLVPLQWSQSEETYCEGGGQRRHRVKTQFDKTWQNLSQGEVKAGSKIKQHKETHAGLSVCRQSWIKKTQIYRSQQNIL